MEPHIEFVTISVEEHLRLLERDRWLTALEEAGVDNWEGISNAHDLLGVDGLEEFFE